MDKLKKNRTALRKLVKKNAKTISDLLMKDELDEVELQVKLESMKDNYEKVSALDEQIANTMLESETYTEKDYDTELNSVEEIKDSFKTIRIKAEKVLKNTDAESVYSATSMSRNTVFHNRYPKIEPKTFNGDIKEWLGYWAQFKNIHEDKQLPVSEKFQYLMQTIKKDSKAYSLVSSYPQSDENYACVIEALKRRFGKEELLVEVYVRELLKLVINHQNNSKHVEIRTMFDTLQSHLRALETLGVTKEKYAAMLFPLVESSFPDSTLQAWHRSHWYRDMKDDNKLSNLMKFLECEVEGEERIKLARDGFTNDGFTKTHNTKKIAAPRKIEERNPATAMGAQYLSRGMVLGAEKTGQFMNYGTPKLLQQIKPEENPTPINPKVRTGLEVAKNVTGGAVAVTGFIASRIGAATMALGRYLAPHVQRQGTKLLSTTCNYSEQEASQKMGSVLQVAAGAVEGFATVYDGLENAAKILGSNLTANTVKIVQHKYGQPAGEVAGNTLYTVGNVFVAGTNVRHLTPKGLAKFTVKQTGKGVVDEYRGSLQNGSNSSQFKPGPSSEVD